jgi:FkbM family methyltransferase
LRQIAPGAFHAIEANPALVAELQLQPFASVRCCAVAAGPGPKTLQVTENDEASSLLPLENGRFGVVRTVAVDGRTLDALLADVPGSLDVVKVDIEGAEVVALQGLQPATLKRIGQISVEFHCADVFGFNLVENSTAAIKNLKAQGFLVLSFVPDRMDVLFVNREHFKITATRALRWRAQAAARRGYTQIGHAVARRWSRARRNGWGWY